jgi:hypothetical protein
MSLRLNAAAAGTVRTFLCRVTFGQSDQSRTARRAVHPALFDSDFAVIRGKDLARLHLMPLRSCWQAPARSSQRLGQVAGSQFVNIMAGVPNVNPPPIDPRFVAMEFLRHPSRVVRRVCVRVRHRRNVIVLSPCRALYPDAHMTTVTTFEAFQRLWAQRKIAGKRKIINCSAWKAPAS